MLVTSVETVGRELLRRLMKIWEMSKSWYEEGTAAIITLNPLLHTQHASQEDK
jgi:hypothetical protein